MIGCSKNGFAMLGKIPLSYSAVFISSVSFCIRSVPIAGLLIRAVTLSNAATTRNTTKGQPR